MKSRASKTLLGCFVIWVAAMAVLSPRFVALHRETQGVERVFLEYSRSIASQDFMAAYQLCGTEFRNATTYEEFVRTYGALQQRYGPLKSAKRVSYEVRGTGTPVRWRAVIDADLIYEKERLRFEFDFRQEEGRWVLFGAREI